MANKRGASCFFFDLAAEAGNAKFLLPCHTLARGCPCLAPVNKSSQCFFWCVACGLGSMWQPVKANGSTNYTRWLLGTWMCCLRRLSPCASATQVPLEKLGLVPCTHGYRLLKHSRARFVRYAVVGDSPEIYVVSLACGVCRLSSPSLE